MKKIVLISCSSKKLETRVKVKAKELYVSPLFRYSLQYAESLRPAKIFILSAKHGLLDLEKKIKPYNSTLSYVSPKKRRKNLKVLTKDEKRNWGKKVIKDLSKYTNLKRAKFIVLAGQSYIEPIRKSFGDDNFEEPLKGRNQGKRLGYLKSKLE